MKKLAAFIFGAIVALAGAGSAVPAHAQPGNNTKYQTRASRKADRKQQKANKKYAKAQQKAQRKMAKKDRKNTHYPKRSY